MTAPRFIDILRADDDAFVRVGSTLCTVRRVSADDAYRKGLGDVLGDRKELRHRLERFPTVILVKSRNDHPFSGVCKFFADVDNIRREELPFIDADNLRVGGEGEDLIARIDNGGNERLLAVGNNMA